MTKPLDAFGGRPGVAKLIPVPINRQSIFLVDLQSGSSATIVAAFTAT